MALGAGGKALGRLGIFRAATSLFRSAPRSVTRDLTQEAGQITRRSLRTGLGNLRTRAREFVSRTLTKDPIDVATGEVVLAQTDVALDGVLPLVLTRTHVSSYRSGTLFGPSWASTLDQRLEVDADGVTLASADGMVLAYPTPTSEGAVWPIEGPRRPLSPEHGGGYAVADPQTGRVHHFGSPGGTHARTLPLTAVTDRNGNRIDLRYDDEAVLTEVRHSGGYRIAVDVADGRVRALRLVTGATSAVELVRYAYDGAGHLAEVIDSSGDPLRFSYDAEGRLTGWIDRNGSWYRYTYDERGRGITGEGADGFLNTRLTYDPDGRYTMVTDSLGHLTTYQLNELSQVVGVVDPLGHRTTSEWDRHDRLLARTDPRGHTTRYRYDAAGNVIEISRPDGRRITGRYNKLNLPVTVVGADEETTWRQEYDTRGNLIAVTDPAGGITRRAYDDRGGLTAVSDALGATTHVTTNPAGLPIRITDPVGAEVRYERDPFGRVTSMTDPAGGVARFGWTAEGRPTWRTSPGGAVERWTYDGEGNPTTHVDPAGQVTRTEYTHFDLPAARTGPHGARLEFGYDTEARLVSVTTSQGLVWRYEYNAAGDLAHETDFNGRRVTYAHDAAGRLISRVDGAGQTTNFVRDPLDRVVAQVTAGRVTAFTYDPAGRLMRAANPEAEVVFQRDRLGLVTAETCNGATVHTAYDALGRRVRRRTPTGAESQWAYDAAGRPVGLRTAGQALGFGYDPAGREIERRIGTGVVLTQEWDPRHRLTAQTLWGAPGVDDATAPGAETPAARLLQHRTYGYRADDHLTAIGDRLAGSRTFDLDQAGRVTAVRADGWTEHYAYDAAGNVTHAAWPAPPEGEASGEETVGERDYSGTLLRRAGRVHYEHDAQGRVVLRRHRTLSGKVLTWAYTWGAGDRLMSIRTPDGRRWHYRYDPLGRRIAKQRVGPEGVVEQTDFRWDGLVLVEQTHTDWQPAGPVRRTLTWDHRPGTFQPLTQTERVPDGAQEWVDERFHAIVTDLVGAPAELVDAAGGVVRQPRRSLWGAGLGRDTMPSSCPLRFPGQYHDSESGLDYNYRRYYDSAGGRYQSGDPLGLTPQPNPHAYVHNPTVSADPLGLAPYPLENNRSMWQQRIEAKAAADRGLTPVTLHEGAGMEGLTSALHGESEFKWAVVSGEGGAHELRVMPANYGANGWPRTEMAHTVLAGPGGAVHAAGSGSVMEGFPAFINRASGHFEPGEETLPIGSAAFEKAGIDVIASNTY